MVPALSTATAAAFEHVAKGVWPFKSGGGGYVQGQPPIHYGLRKLKDKAYIQGQCLIVEISTIIIVHVHVAKLFLLATLTKAEP